MLFSIMLRGLLMSEEVGKHPISPGDIAPAFGQQNWAGRLRMTLRLKGAQLKVESISINSHCQKTTTT